MISTRPDRWWSHALTLAERSVLAADSSTTRAPDVAAAAPTASPIDRWRAQRPFDRPELLARRLRADRLTIEDFGTLLGTPPEQLAIGARAPSWVGDIERVDAVAEQIAERPHRVVEGDTSGLAPVRAFVEPFVTAGMTRLYDAVQTLVRDEPCAPFDPKRATLLFEPQLWGQLIGRAMKVVVLELNVARVRGALVGETAVARCEYFATQLRAGPVRDQVMAEYPVLARSIVAATDTWFDAAIELLRHLAEDIHVVREVFAEGADPGPLIALTLGAGDSHRGGRSVAIVEFGSGLRVVYKPRPLAVDRHFHDLIDWINARAQTPALRAVRSITIDAHGWAEWVPNDACDSTEALGRFYERFGALIAVLHALNATDFHYENVIASGELPVLIDLEALFHPQSGSTSIAGEPEGLGWEALQRSVMRTGVLPFRSYDNDQSSGLDLSAMGGSGGQETPNRFPVLVAVGTDEMRFEPNFVRLPESQNRPTLGGKPADPTSFVGRVLDGFTSTYRLLLAHRDELLAPSGPLWAFADDPIRAVLRPTRQYALILGETHHPDVLRDAVERDRLIDRLWVAVPSRPELEQVVRLEHEDLLRGDVPLYMSRPSSRSLFTTHGSELASFFRQSGLDAAIQRIEALSEEDLGRQRWVIEAALVGLAPGSHAEMAPPSVTVTSGEIAPPSRDAAVDAARNIANRLVRLALRRGDLVNWLGLTLVRERDWVVQPVAADLYSGSAGIALFLAYVDHLTGDPEAGEIADLVAAQLSKRIAATIDALGDDPTLAPGSLGAFGMVGGAIYTLSHIAVLRRDAAALDLAERAVCSLRAQVSSDVTLDIIGGTAGFVMAAAALHHARPSASVRDAVRHAAERLLERGEQSVDTLSWVTSLSASRPLTGMSHGASGMALALLSAGRVLRDDRFARAAIAAMRYERGTFDAARQNWPDFRLFDARSPADEPPVMWAWCHGAPGIGLARLAALGTGDAAIADDVATALESTARFGFGSNDSLCHGDLGNLDLFIAARACGLAGSWEGALAHAGRLVARLRQGVCYCGIPGGLETPGLMTGLAGIGYGLLRLAFPERVPSVLALEPPSVTLPGRSES